MMQSCAAIMIADTKTILTSMLAASGIALLLLSIFRHVTFPCLRHIPRTATL